jgi:deazaflavin-dependent oxidoreductase (nitroreductase family)
MDEAEGPTASVIERAIEWLVFAFLRLINPLMKRALASPFHVVFSHWFLLLSFTGRKSGRPISTPVSYVGKGETLTLTTKNPWWRNLEAAGAVETTVRGRRAQRSVEVVRGEDAVVEALADAPGWFLFLAALGDGRAGRPNAEDFRRSAREGRVVLHLGTAGGREATREPRVTGTRGSPSES